jgi:hypothetical protein
MRSRLGISGFIAQKPDVWRQPNRSAGREMDMFDDLLAVQLPPVAIHFFQIFSRFECAMKRSGRYVKGDEQWVTPRWGLLADDLGADFLTQVRESGRANTLIAQPPNTQVILPDGSLGWKANEPVQQPRR